MTPTLEERFDAAMMRIYHRAKSEVGYNATRYLQILLARGGLETAKLLLGTKAVSEGYTALWELGRLDLTVEAMITDHAEWHEFFTDEELAAARQRLGEYGYARHSPS